MKLKTLTVSIAFALASLGASAQIAKGNEVIGIYNTDTPQGTNAQMDPIMCDRQVAAYGAAMTYDDFPAAMPSLACVRHYYTARHSGPYGTEVRFPSQDDYRMAAAMYTEFRQGSGSKMYALAQAQWQTVLDFRRNKDVDLFSAVTRAENMSIANESWGAVSVLPIQWVVAPTGSGLNGDIANKLNCSEAERERAAAQATPAASKLAVAAYMRKCSPEAKAAQSKAQADFIAAQKKPELRALSPEELKPVPKVADDKTEVLKLLNGGELASVTIGSPDASTVLTMMVDLGQNPTRTFVPVQSADQNRSRDALKAHWPAVKAGKERITVVPTTLHSGQGGDATWLLASSNPQALLDVYVQENERDMKSGQSLFDAVIETKAGRVKAKCIDKQEGDCDAKFRAVIAEYAVDPAAKAAKVEAVRKNDSLIAGAKIYGTPLIAISQGNGKWPYTYGQPAYAQATAKVNDGKCELSLTDLLFKDCPKGFKK